MSEYLEQTRRYSREQFKYSVDCDKIKSNPESLQILSGSVRAKHTIVITAVSKEFDGKVVVKIGKTNEHVEQEYNVAKQLETAGLNGFIRMQCIFRCGHDDLTKYHSEIEPKTFKICHATTETQNIDVLIMPYIVGPNGNATTLHNYLETGGDIVSYKTIIRKVIVNLREAFLKTGFVHKDLHFGNVLIDSTGEPIIMDFDTSDFVNPIESQAYFWSDVHRFFSHVIEKSYPSNLKSYTLTNSQSIFTIISTLLMSGTTTNISTQVHNIIMLIDASDVIVQENNPTKIFGGGRTKKRRK